MFFLITYLTLFIQFGRSQTLTYQDVFKGSVSVIGLNNNGITIYNLNNFGSSTVRKAFLLIGNQVDNKYSQTCVINNDTYLIDSNTVFGERFPSLTLQYSGSNHIIDVTPSVLTNNITFSTTPTNINPPDNPNQRNISFTLIVLFDNVLNNTVNFCLYLNSKNNSFDNTHNYSSINPVEVSSPIAVSFSLSHMMNTSMDGSNVQVNGNNIGLIGGPNEFGLITTGNILGQHYYVNGQIIDIGDDTGDNLMNGSDVLADISSYCNQYDTSLNVKLTYQDSFANELAYSSNPLWSTTLAYTTPCDTFSVSVPNDTTVCYGTQLQINVTGGQKYEWLPSAGLSCDTCSNPIFTADSSMNYTVRIWNNDSCSVVRPLQILVSQPRIDTLLISPPTCGTNDGEIAVNASSFSWFNLSYSSGGAFQTDSVLSNLAEGNITVTVQDEAGCSVDSSFFLPSVNNTNALFTVNPPGGEDVPLVNLGK